MKKSILLVAVIAVAFTSCKKDRTCTCTDTTVTTTTTSFPGTTPTTKTTEKTNAGVITYTKARKGDAKSACASYKMSDSGTQGSYVSWTSEETMDCTLK